MCIIVSPGGSYNSLSQIFKIKIPNLAEKLSMSATTVINVSDRPENQVTTVQVTSCQPKVKKMTGCLWGSKTHFQTPGFDFYVMFCQGLTFWVKNGTGCKCEERQDSILNIRHYPPLMFVYTFFFVGIDGYSGHDVSEYQLDTSCLQPMFCTCLWWWKIQRKLN